jgi:predicted PurR-regulated permease PerM
MMELLQRHSRSLVAMAALVIVGAGIKAASGILDSLLLAVLLTIAILPVFDTLRRRGRSNFVAIAVPTATLLLAILALIAFLGIAATQLVQVVPGYQSRLDDLVQLGQRLLAARGIDAREVLSAEIANPGRLLNLAATVLERLGQVLGQAVFLLLIVAFALVEAAVRGKQDRTVKPLVAEVARAVRQYLVITAALALVFAAFCYVLMLIVGTDLAIVWAVFVFVMSFVPNVGFILSMLPPTALTLLEFGWERALVVAGGFFIANFFLDNLVKPRFMASGLDLSPLVGLLSLVVWSYLLGPIGAILAIPITIALRILVLPKHEESGAEGAQAAST